MIQQANFVHTIGQLVYGTEKKIDENDDDGHDK